MYCKTILAVVATSALIGSANAATITVGNAGFELPGNSTIKGGGDHWNDVPSWIATGTIADDSGTTSENKRTGSYGGKIDSANNGGGFYQLTDHTIATGEQFTLTFYANTSWDGQDTAFTYSLIYGNTSQVLATDDFYWDKDDDGNGNPNPLISAGFQEITLVGTATAPMDGSKVGIMFTPFTGSGGSFPIIDDVSLEVVPEPGSLALLGLGGLLIGARRRR